MLCVWKAVNKRVVQKTPRKKARLFQSLWHISVFWYCRRLHIFINLFISLKVYKAPDSFQTIKNVSDLERFMFAFPFFFFYYRASLNKF